MKKIVVIGSFNLDYVFSVDRFVKAKETLHSNEMELFFGGKGFNQSIALAKSYPEVYLAANVNEKDAYIKDVLTQNNVNTTYLNLISSPTGMAFIQVNPEGENCILLNKGANHQFTLEQCNDILAQFSEGDLLVLQNEINLLGEIIELARKKGLSIAFNPSPFDETILKLPLSDLDYMFINETEGEALTHESEPQKILDIISSLYPNLKVILTLGSNGSVVLSENQIYKQNAYHVNAVDSTGAGDTYTGYYLSSLILGNSVEESLQMASAASALSVTKPGAMDSIPDHASVIEFIKQQ